MTTDTINKNFSNFLSNKNNMLFCSLRNDSLLGRTTKLVNFWFVGKFVMCLKIGKAWVKHSKRSNIVNTPHVVTLGRKCTSTLIKMYCFVTDVLYLSQLVLPSHSLRSKIVQSGKIKESSPRLIEHRGTDYFRPCRKFYSRSLPVAWCGPGMLRPTEVLFTYKKVHSYYVMGGCSGRTGTFNWWRYDKRKQKDANFNWNLSIAATWNSRMFAFIDFLMKVIKRGVISCALNTNLAVCKVSSTCLLLYLMRCWTHSHWRSKECT